ncbi:hypothetical protein EON66_06565 [archaeon]|nr:MAG: hypothetical protein EON66_06565 [archaeon]
MPLAPGAVASLQWSVDAGQHVEWRLRMVANLFNTSLPIDVSLLPCTSAVVACAHTELDARGLPVVHLQVPPPFSVHEVHDALAPPPSVADGAATTLLDPEATVAYEEARPTAALTPPAAEQVAPTGADDIAAVVSASEQVSMSPSAAPVSSHENVQAQARDVSQEDEQPAEFLASSSPGVESNDHAAEAGNVLAVSMPSDSADKAAILQQAVAEHATWFIVQQAATSHPIIVAVLALVATLVMLLSLLLLCAHVSDVGAPLHAKQTLRRSVRAGGRSGWQQVSDLGSGVFPSVM